MGKAFVSADVAIHTEELYDVMDYISVEDASMKSGKILDLKDLNRKF